jgi:hypothetical protein
MHCDLQLKTMFIEALCGIRATGKYFPLARHRLARSLKSAVPDIVLCCQPLNCFAADPARSNRQGSARRKSGKVPHTPLFNRDRTMSPGGTTRE